MKVIKVINNNNLCVADNNGKEQIVSGKGIGFGKKYGDEVDASQIQKTYLITDSELQKKMISLLKDIPPEHMIFSNDMVEHIKKTYSARLNESLLVTLSDHISFAIERRKNGNVFENPLLESIREIYPEELSLGRYCTEQIYKRFGVIMPEDEAGFIAMHIISARIDGKVSDVYDIANIVEGCIEIATSYFDKEPDRGSDSFERFLIHLKYLAQRLSQNKPLPKGLSDDAAFVSLVKSSFGVYYKCALCIQEYIFKTYKKNINEDEIITLSIHLKKIFTHRNG